jgi:two-component system, OmpR family, response regulator
MTLSQLDQPTDMLDLDFTKPAMVPVETPRVDKKMLLLEAMIGENELATNGLFVRVNDNAPKRKPRHKPPRVLIVEDDDTTATVISGILGVTGFHVLRARDKASVVEGLRESPDLVILDVLMPELNGLDLLARLRKHPKLVDLPVLMLTSLGSVDDILNGLLQGANGYLTKPCKSRVLLQAIKQVLT